MGLSREKVLYERENLLLSRHRRQASRSDQAVLSMIVVSSYPHPGANDASW
jgi:hypothetical protein